MEVSEIKTLMTDLEKASAVDRILEILDTFDKEVKPTEKLLKVSGIALFLSDIFRSNLSFCRRRNLELL